LVSILLKVSFAHDSDKISNVTFSTVRDSIESGDFDHLDAQVSYPSVVSLDADKCARRSESIEDGPGMDY